MINAMSSLKPYHRCLCYKISRLAGQALIVTSSHTNDESVICKSYKMLKSKDARYYTFLHILWKLQQRGCKSIEGGVNDWTRDKFGKMSRRAAKSLKCSFVIHTFSSYASVPIIISANEAIYKLFVVHPRKCLLRYYVKDEEYRFRSFVTTYISRVLCI